MPVRQISRWCPDFLIDSKYIYSEGINGRIRYDLDIHVKRVHRKIISTSSLLSFFPNYWKWIVATAQCVEAPVTSPESKADSALGVRKSHCFANETCVV